MATAVTLPGQASLRISPIPGGPGRSDLGMGGIMRPNGSSRRESLENPFSKTPDEDPLRILAPAQKKLTTIEAQRVLAVMDETVKRLEGAMTLPFLADSLQRFSVSLGVELVAIVEEYQQLVAKYNTLCEVLEVQGVTPKVDADEASGYNASGERTPSASSLRSDPGSTGRPVQLDPLDLEDGLSAEEKFHQVRHRLKHCVKSILRGLARNPSTGSIMQAASKDRSWAGSLLLESVGNLRGITNENLLTSRVEEVQRKEHLRLVGERQQSAEEEIERLEAQLEKAQQLKDEEVVQKNAQIKRLKSNIKTVINLAEDANRRVRTDTSNQMTQDEKAHEGKTTKLQEDITTVRKNLQEMVASNREKEQDLRKRAFKRETEVENWIQKYDQEMGDKQDELEEMETEFEEEKKQLKELDERLGILSLEYEGVIKEQEEARTRAEEADSRMRVMLHAARVIQRCWRKYREFKKQQKAQQKGKKGKGKKGKGKGKGKKKN